MNSTKNRVCPVERAGKLDNRIRRWLQNPRKILKPHIKEGMVVLDLGCGPGFFTIEMAQMVGETGRVIACDLQEGMLRKLKSKIEATKLEERITLQKCEENRIGVPPGVDFVLAFYVVHEVPDKAGLFAELASIIRSTGQVFMVEPSFHVSKRAFEDTIEIARAAGLLPVERPKLFLGRAVTLGVL